MKVIALSIVLAPPEQSSVILSQSTDLSQFSFYQKPSIAEFLSFFTKTVSERTQQGGRQSVMENNYVAHVFNCGGAERLAAVAITDQEYPVRPAFSLLQKILEEFISTVSQSCYENLKPENCSGTNNVQFAMIQTYLQKYQDPRQADAIMKVQAELDETKIILVSS